MGAVPLRRRMLWGRLCRALASGLVGLLPAFARATPFVPKNDATIIERLPDGTDPAARQLRALHAQLARTPTNLALALRVAKADTDRAIAKADPRWIGRAEAALAPWPQNAATPPEVTLQRAIAVQYNHQFTLALTLLKQVLHSQPNNAEAWLVSANIDTLRADYGTALADCGQVASHVLGLVPDTCTASIMALQGEAKRALKVLDLSNHMYVTDPPPVHAWATGIAAEIAGRLADPSTDARFRAALAANPTDPYELAAYADFLLDQNRPAEVVSLLAAYRRVDPLLLRLAMAEQALHSPALADDMASLTQRFAASRARGDTVHQREEAMFELKLRHNPARALMLARANWQVQRAPEDARILLEAARAAGTPSAANPVRQWLAQNHIEDARLTTLAAETTPQAGD